MLVLGIETSCDETSIALYSDKYGILNSYTASQADIHSKYGGVVPEIASRNHILNIKPLFDDCIKESNISLREIDIIGVTNAPGLVGALFTGVSFAKGLSYSLSVPLVPVNHIVGHILSAEIENSELTPPYLALIISGGHTHIYFVDKCYNFKLISRTLDDAVGESFDKVAKMLGFGYPGGPYIEKHAENGNENAVKFPVGMKSDINLSYSGLKTAVFNEINKKEHPFQDIAASFQKAVADSLNIKIEYALNYISCDKIVVAGGAACNKYLRKKIIDKFSNTYNVFFPSPKLCSDNGDMIAYAASKMYSLRKFMGVFGEVKDSEFNIHHIL